MVIIAIIVICFIVAVYREVLNVVPGFYNYLCLLGVLGLSMGLITLIATALVQPSSSQKRQIEEARAQDADITEKLRQEAVTSTQKWQERIRALKDQLKQHQANIRNNDVLSDNDKDLNTVNWIINQIESRRADSVKEALLLYDDKRRRDSAFELKKIQMQFETDRRNREALDNSIRDLQNTINQKKFERKMERIESEKLEELRSINEKLSR